VAANGRSSAEPREPPPSKERVATGGAGSGALLVAALVALATGYLAIANAVLAWVPRFRGPGFDLDAGAVYSFVPGHLHLEDARLSGTAPAGWILTLDRADARLDLRELLAGRLHVASLRGTGLEAGFDAGGARWILDGGRVRTRSMRAAPEAAVGGGASVSLASAALRVGGELLAEDLRGTVDLTLAPPSSDADGATRARRLAVSADVEGALVSLAALSPERIRSSGGSLRARIVVDGGVLAEGTEIEASPSSAVLTLGADEVILPAGALVTVTAGAPEAAALTVRARMPHIDAPHVHDDAGGSAKDVLVEIDLAAAGLGRESWRPVAARVEMGLARARIGAGTWEGTASADLALGGGPAQIEHWGVTGGWVRWNGVLAPPSDGGFVSELRGQLDVHRASCDSGGVSLDGALDLTASDVAAGLYLAGVARLHPMLAFLAGRPLSLEADVTRRPEALLLRPLALASPGVTARGAVAAVAGETSAALLVHVATHSAGVSVEDGDLRIVPDADDAWLADRLAELPSTPR
jgi:hypothetical protein